ncbi:fatty acid desaturase family protein [Dolichospermum flos-aquae]|jgi:fatty acid desaturase|uniref:Fatty acid desaturase n=1 Tax=Dolichospermum flos-aquae CCAP 1403/13F TaxID=315271 RepID=A0A6H2C7H0_DOLFA|nr:fatty acid desaturase [Dolichospermum flos-aquae]QJB47250.1 fatty acid desaturase [Dolichospermum flos-aquae CCAP 1403/13F]
MTLTNISQDLQEATTDLHQINPSIGLLRFGVLGLIFLSLVILAWSVPMGSIYLVATMLAGVVYSFLLICTHDMTHQTLTGWKWFDIVMPRLISWPILSPYGVYGELHRLHHAWNGTNLRDPERMQWTKQEYEQASPLLQWYVRHQWGCDIFLLGGIGLIVKTLLKGLQFQKLVSNMRRQLLLDVVGILLVQGVFLTLVISHFQLWRYLLFWFILERIIGIILQTRDHLEHYALWGRFKNHQLTQMYASRNLQTSSLVGWLMGGLNYHAVHHAFPDIPFNQLPEAFERIQKVLQKHGFPAMQLDAGYLKSTYWLSSHPSLIDEVG